MKYKNLVLVALMLLAACSSNSDYSEHKEEGAHTSAPVEKASTKQKTPKKMAYGGSLSLHSNRPDSLRAAVEEVLQANKGYVAEEQLVENNLRYELRVPADAFLQTMRQLEAVGDSVLDRHITAEDVGIEFVDLEARIKAKQRVEAEVSRMLQSAHTLEDIFAVRDRLNPIREEIENAQGRIKYLENKTTYSTIRLSLIYTGPPPALPEPPAMFFRIWAALEFGWQGLFSVLVALLSVWPLWLVGTTVALILRKRGVKFS